MAQVAVAFARPNDGGLHDVVISPSSREALEIWRGWPDQQRILVVVSPSETVTEDAAYDTRWFSSSGEIELCGSGAVAAAHLIFSKMLTDLDRICLRGTHHIIAAMTMEEGVRIRLPRFDTSSCTLPSSVYDRLGIVTAVTCVMSPSLRTVVVRLPDGTDLLSIKPDFTGLGSIQYKGLEALILTVKGEDPGAFDYRYFTPWHGLDESQVAVSGNALLGPFWQQHWNTDFLVGRQLSDSGPLFQLRVDEQGAWVESKHSVVVSSSNVILGVGE